MFWVAGLILVGVFALLAVLSGSGLLLDAPRLFGSMDDAHSEAKAKALADEVRREKAAEDARSKSRAGGD